MEAIITTTPSQNLLLLHKRIRSTRAPIQHAHKARAFSNQELMRRAHQRNSLKHRQC